MDRRFPVVVAALTLAAFLPAVPLAATPSPAAAAGRDLSQARSALAGTHWRLVEFQSMDDAVGTVRPDDPSLYTMELNDDGTVAMRLNCNRAAGSWSAEPGEDGTSGSFAFGPLAMTRAACPPPSMDERIARDAEYIRSYVLRGSLLYLSLMADAGIYLWEEDAEQSAAARVPAAPEDGGPRAWATVGLAGDLELREQPSATASVIASYPADTILSNLGCQREAETVWCDVQPLVGGARGYVSADFLQPAVSPDGAVATGYDDSASRAGQGDFDATGTIPCAQDSGQPLGDCMFGVARSGGGYATVVIERAEGSRRAIFFQMGIPTGADTSQADGYPEFSATKESDLNLIRVGTERYEIPDAVVLGG